jgi:transcriptional regulator with XRE-family HTH domain
MPSLSVYKTEPATLGEAMLREIPASVAKIATALGLRSPQAVQFWRHGSKLPGPESRERLAATYGIPIDAWSRPANDQTSAEPAELGSTAPSAPAVSSSALEGVRALLKEVRSRRPAPGADATSMDYFRSVRLEADLLRQIAQFEQAAEAMDDRIIRTNPRWAKIRDGLADVLAHYPDAAERVAAMLDRLDV